MFIVFECLCPQKLSIIVQTTTFDAIVRGVRGGLVGVWVGTLRERKLGGVFET